MQSQSAPPAPAPPPPPSPTPVIVSQDGRQVLITQTGEGSAYQVWQGAVQQRDELRNQLERLEDRRRAIAQRLREGEVEGADRAGLESRLTELDGQINVKYKELSVADQRVATTAGIPGATENPNPQPRRDETAESAIIGGTMISIAVFLPLSIAYARRIWRKATSIGHQPPASQEMSDRMTRIEEAVEAIAIEVERVGEGQRFITRLLAPGSAAAEPIKLRERAGVER